MPDYRLFQFEREQIRRSESLRAADDSAAETAAARRLAGSKAELWRGAKLLKVFEARR